MLRTTVCLTFALAVPGSAGDPPEEEPPPAGALLRGVIEQLPRQPLNVTGELLVRRRRGVPVATYGFDMQTQWGAQPPWSRYIVYDAFGRQLEQLTITHGPSPRHDYRTGDPPVETRLPSLAHPIQQSDLTWLDLTLAFLWWTDAHHDGEESVRGFDCHVIRVTAPPDAQVPYAAVRLWISKADGLLLQAEGLDAQGHARRRLWVRSVRKLDDAWMIKDMEVQAFPAVQRTRLHIADIETPEP